MGPFLQIQNYEDIGVDSVEAQNYLYQSRRKHEISIEKCAAKPRGVKERNPPDKGGFTPSKRSPRAVTS